MDVINQTVGDAISDLLVVETVLHARGWSIQDWEEAYTDLPNRQLKVVVKVRVKSSGFGGLEVACWPLVPKFVGSHQAEAVGFIGRKNPQHAFLRRGSKAVVPMS
jgi:hypothetical protein